MTTPTDLKWRGDSIARSHNPTAFYMTLYHDPLPDSYLLYCVYRARQKSNP